MQCSDGISKFLNIYYFCFMGFFWGGCIGFKYFHIFSNGFK